MIEMILKLLAFAVQVEKIDKNLKFYTFYMAVYVRKNLYGQLCGDTEKSPYKFFSIYGSTGGAV